MGTDETTQKYFHVQENRHTHESKNIQHIRGTHHAIQCRNLDPDKDPRRPTRLIPEKTPKNSPQRKMDTNRKYIQDHQLREALQHH